MAAAAVHLSERIFERLSDQRVLFVGAVRWLSCVRPILQGPSRAS